MDANPPPIPPPMTASVPPVIPGSPGTPRQHSPGPGGNVPPTPPRPAGQAWKWTALIALGFLGLGLLGWGLGAVLPHDVVHQSRGHVRHGAGDLEEYVLEDNDADHHLAVVAVEGVIGSEAVEPGGAPLADLLRDQFERIRADHRVKAVLLRVDSPGGEVLASDEIYRAIEEFQADTKLPVIASMGSLAASGGYYVSAACRWIVANELSITGSIGVIFHGYNYRGLLDKVGVRPKVTKSGKLKDMWSGDKRPEEELPEEAEIMQGMVDETFQRFKTVVREGRQRAAGANGEEGRRLAPDWESIADGRVVSGRTAFEKGLVDELGNFDTAVKRALKIAGLEKANLVTYQPPASFLSLFRFLGQGPAGGRTVQVQLGLEGLPRLPQGRLYFLSPVHAP